MPRETTAVVWFRRDLRVHDHPALQHALTRFERVVPLFVVDPAILDGRWRSANRRWFLAGALEALDGALRERDSQLMVVRGDPADVVPSLAAEIGAAAVVASRDYSPYGRRRDTAVERVLAGSGIRFEAGRGVLIQEPEALAREGGGAFAAFAPFRRRWEALPVRAVLPAPDRVPTAPLPGRPALAQRPPVADLIGDATPTADRTLLLEPTEPAARARLERWATSEALDRYDMGRDRLDIDGTSRLSQDLRWGLLSPVEVLARTAGGAPGRVRYRSELAWRDFYAHLLWHEPRVAHASFRSELDGVARSADAALVDAWKEGRTGYPVVDAAMRQLRATGWMHNRARMIVASFLTKQLGIDWRVGEAHFMEHLVDGDPASNNGGWQWAASTGTDPQPYVRIFNPALQGRRHDPDGAYVRQWVPELRRIDMSAADVQEPPPGTYIDPIVDHREARAASLAAYRNVSRARPSTRS